MKRPFITFVVIVALMIVSGLIGWYEARSTQENVHIDTVRTEVVDTIPYYQPVAKDSAVVRYVTRYLAAKPQGTTERDITAAKDSTMVQDSAAVTVPITQKKYETEDYRAYVSGYEAQLDSIFVNRKTVNESVVVTRQHTQQKRISVGIVAGAGYGIRSKQGDFFVGVGISYRLF